MSATLTIRLDDQLNEQLNELARLARRSKSELVREMLWRQAAVEELRTSRATLMPYAERAGFLTDEDFFRAVS